MVQFMPTMFLKHLLYLSIITQHTLFGSCDTALPAVDLGECYEAEGNTNRAQASYERALIEDKDNVPARLKLASLYNNMKMRKQANAVLIELDDNQLTPQQRTSLATLKQNRKELSNFRARTTLELGYDSNINISPLTDNLPIGIEPRSSTLFTRVKADGSYMHDLSTQGGWYFRSDANIYYQNNFSAHTFDVLYGHISVGSGYYGREYSLYVPLFYKRLDYLDRDLLQESGIRPTLNLSLSNNFIFNVTASYSMRRYIQSQDRLRDDDISRAESALIWIESKNMAYLRGRYENYMAQNSVPIAFTNKTLYYAQVGGLYSFNNIVDLRLNYQYRYANFAPYTTIKRTDNNHDIKIKLEKDIYTHLQLSAQYRYMINNSNYYLAEYTKHEAILGLIYNY